MLPNDTQCDTFTCLPNLRCSTHMETLLTDEQIVCLCIASTQFLDTAAAVLITRESHRQSHPLYIVFAISIAM